MREETYSGPFANLAPDVLYELHPGYETRDSLYGKEIVTPSPFRTGTHRVEGMYVVNGPGLPIGEEKSEVNLVDVFPTILSQLGITMSPGVGGRVLWAPHNLDPS